MPKRLSAVFIGWNARYQTRAGWQRSRSCGLAFGPFYFKILKDLDSGLILRLIARAAFTWRGKAETQERLILLACIYMER